MAVKQNFQEAIAHLETQREIMGGCLKSEPVGEI